MASTLFRCILNNAVSVYKTNTTNLRTIHTNTAYYAARKGTRAKARAKKVKVEVTKVGFIPHNQRGRKEVTQVRDRHADDSYKPLPVDDVYLLKYYRWVVYTVEDAVKAHQETHHPTMFNVPDALVYAKIEFNMEAAKKNRYIDGFVKLSLLPHPFPRDEERTILVFCKNPDLARDTVAAGATMAGGGEIIKKIQDGQIKLSDYDYIVAHPNILTELVPIRGLMKKRFPNVRSGTLDPNLTELVKKFAGGIQYRLMKDEVQPNYGCIEVPIGRLNMEPKQIADNVDVLLKDMQLMRPRRDGLFITRCLIKSPPSKEIFKIDPFVYVDRELSKEVQEDSDDEDEPAAAASKA
ncbi:50S ribosomal protein L1 [Manduca sexta]|uniref:50S ribosomal protein L1 n=1 Tax=Manduca sexta TaxID=7130 RepID=UPI00188DF197|nr:50S ribosomal protein L1 [Manduca sexta]